MKDSIDKLNSDYIKNVLPHLFSSASEDTVTDFLSGYSPSGYTIKLDLKSILQSAPEYKPIGKFFIHFTSLRSLHSILNEVAIRMYDLTGMNDPREFEMIANEFGYDKFSINIFKKYIYVFSMCPSEVLGSNEILNLWSRYGNDGNGCAIEFEIEDQFESLSYIKMAKINYTKPDYSKFFIANKKFEERTGLTVDLKDLIQLTACLHKDPIYTYESEVRLFYEGGWTSPEKTYEDNAVFGYDFTSKSKIISFHKVKLYNQNISFPNIKIKRIQLGFNFPEIHLQEFKEHLELLYMGISMKLGRKVIIPEVEISPLREKYQ